jgi:hypothetical protein
MTSAVGKSETLRGTVATLTFSPDLGPTTPADCPDDLTSTIVDGSSQQPVSGATVQLLQATKGQPFTNPSYLTTTDPDQVRRPRLCGELDQRPAVAAGRLRLLRRGHRLRVYLSGCAGTVTEKIHGASRRLVDQGKQRRRPADFFLLPFSLFLFFYHRA